MAATRLITVHQNKGKSVAKSLSDRTDYAKNGEKIENGQFISSYACQAESVDEEFIRSYDDLEKNVKTATAHYTELSASIKEKEKRLAEI